MEEIDNLLKSLPHLPNLNFDNPNKLKVPKIKLRFVEDDIKLFNKIYCYIIKSKYRRFEATKSGGIPCCQYTRYFAWYVIRVCKHAIEFTFRGPIGTFRFIIGAAKDERTGVTGSEAYFTFRKVCKDLNIDLDSLAVDNGKEIKETISSPKIELSGIVEKGGLIGKGVNITNCHHIDINSAYMACIAAKYPILEPAIQKIYNERKSDATGRYKAILTHAYGYFQSKYCIINNHGYALSNLSKTAVSMTREILELFAKNIIKQGGIPLLYNTDGLWYKGPKFVFAGEGTALGGWKHDYVDCTLNIKSKGAYQFEGIEVKTGNKIFKPVFRGVSSYEREIPRDEWKWDDIYKGSELIFKFDELRGIVYEEDKFKCRI